MALLTYPLSLDQFFHLLPASEITLDLPESLDVARTEGGDLVTADIGTRLWAGTIDLGAMLHDEVGPIRALINHLRGGGKSFLVSDLTRPWPRFDPGGLMLTGSNPTIGAIGGTMRDMTITGLPAWYPLCAGDLLSITYGSPTRWGMHELVGDVQANSLGTTGYVEVNPPIRPGALAGAAVQLVWPRCKARLVPAQSVTGTSKDAITTGAKFAWLQQLGA